MHRRLITIGILLVQLFWALRSGAADGLLQIGSASHPSLAPAGGSGDSVLPVISPEGRFVLFSSTANNLGDALVPSSPPRMNVFLRDRLDGTIKLASVSTNGTGGGDGDSFPGGVSTNGRFALFESSAGNLIFGDTNNASDIFVRDFAGGGTILVSVATNGSPGNGVSRAAVMTPDGRYVAFVSAANNLVSNDTNGIPDIFVRDLVLGTTLIASPGAAATGFNPQNSSEAPAITPDGRYLAFYSTATNLVPGATNVAGEIFVRDLVGGITIWASTNAQAIVQSNLHGNASSFNHVISANGQFVAFECTTNPPSKLARGLVLRYDVQSGQTDLIHTNVYVPRTRFQDANNLAMTPDGRFMAFVANTNGAIATTTCVLLWDAQTGANTLISGDGSGAVPGNSICNWPAIDASGRFVAFLSSATNLAANAAVGDYHLYLRDTQTGTTELINADTNAVGSPVSPMTAPQLSADGPLVAFESPDSSLVSDDRNHATDVFLRDVGAGTTELVSRRNPALPSATPNGPSTLFQSPVTGDGRLIVFASDGDNLSADDTNACRDVFVRDLVSGITTLVSIGTNGTVADGPSSEATISSDGRFVAFSSMADDLAGGDANKGRDVFVRDLQTGVTVLASIATNGPSGNGWSQSPLISAGGRYVLFRSRAFNLAPGPYSSSTAENLFLRDLQSSTTWALTRGGVTAASMTPDGHFVAFVGGTSNITQSLRVWDSQAAALVYAGNSVAPASLCISPDGNKIAFSVTNQLVVLNRIANSSVTAAPRLSAYQGRMQFSADGQFLVFGSSSIVVSGDTNNAYDVFIYDTVVGTTILVSRGYDSGIAANGWSDSPGISAEGRLVVYRSIASNIVPGDNNGLPDLFVYDRVTGSNSVLTASAYGRAGANNWPMAANFSPDGHSLVFSSWASDLNQQDLNQFADVFSFRLLFADIAIQPSGQGPIIGWPALPGRGYAVQYKDDLNDPSWHPVSGTVSINGIRAMLQDLSPNAGQRFYRVTTF